MLLLIPSVMNSIFAYCWHYNKTFTPSSTEQSMWQIKLFEKLHVSGDKKFYGIVMER